MIIIFVKGFTLIGCNKTGHLNEKKNPTSTSATLSVWINQGCIQNKNLTRTELFTAFQDDLRSGNFNSSNIV